MSHIMSTYCGDKIFHETVVKFTEMVNNRKSCDDEKQEVYEAMLSYINKDDKLNPCVLKYLFAGWWFYNDQEFLQFKENLENKFDEDKVLDKVLDKVSKISK